MPDDQTPPPWVALAQRALDNYMSNFSQVAQDFARATWATWTADDAKAAAAESFQAAQEKIDWNYDQFPPAADRPGTLPEQAAAKAISLLQTLDAGYTYLLLAMAKGLLPDNTPDFYAAALAVNGAVEQLIPMIAESSEADGYTRGYIDGSGQLARGVTEALKAAHDWAQQQVQDVSNFFDGQFDILKAWLEAFSKALDDTFAKAWPWVMGGAALLGGLALFSFLRR